MNPVWRRICSASISQRLKILAWRTYGELLPTRCRFVFVFNIEYKIIFAVQSGIRVFLPSLCGL